MKHNPYSAFVAVFILAVSLFQPGAASAQDDMKDMPGMAPAAPKKDTVTDDAASAEQKKTDAMPGMKHDAAPAESKMDAMPGMAPAKPGASGKKDNMPGMEGDEAATQPTSEPGIRILGPHQPWVPPAGDDRANELLPQSMLKAHMEDLPEPVEDSMINSLMLFDLLEYRAYDSGPAALTWDFVGWIGGDYNRLWIKSEGDMSFSRGNGVEADLQLLYGRLIAPFWDLQLGVRGSLSTAPGRSDNSRTYAVLGLQGLAPGFFEFEPALYISDRGEVSGQLTASIDFYLTQRLILQPRFEGGFSFQGDNQFDTASGVNQTELGLRLRYEITREFAPYIGLSWQHLYGGTADIARSGGDSTYALALVLGVRVWF